ncbi:MAG: sporulation protein [Ardenticatenaceae bacterium]
MSFVKRVLSSIGVGSATVDTILFGEQFAPGDTMSGMVMVKGGDVEQQIDDIYLSIKSTYQAEEGYGTISLKKLKLAQAFVIGAREKKEFSLSMPLPFYTPLTMGKTKVWVETGLDIKSAIDPGDTDYIQVVPGQLISALFDSLNQLGFSLRKSHTELASYKLRHLAPLMQEFEFRPSSGTFRGRLDELEVVPILNPGGVQLFMEVDRRTNGLGGLFSEAFDLDETRVQFSFGVNDLPNLTDQLYQHINQWS